MRANDTTEFSEKSTNHNANPEGVVPTMMSGEGERLAKKTAPASAFKVAERTRISDGPSNPLHRTMDKIFRSPR
jgi:hypothetical protein